jgi:hypothetical protein
MTGKGDRNRTADLVSYENNWKAIFGKGHETTPAKEEMMERANHTFGGAKLDTALVEDALVTRLEVIKEGRILTQYLEHDEKLELSYQDGGRTLKVFINKR